LRPPRSTSCCFRLTVRKKLFYLFLFLDKSKLFY
jgi:hypothetical protein